MTNYNFVSMRFGCDNK